MSLGSIARELSKLERFVEPKLELEQYPTPGELAAELVWNARLAGDVDGRRIIDLGAGTGVLGIGALFAGASHVTFVEQDPDAIVILKRNLERFDQDRYAIIEGDALQSSGSFDTCIMNPPFGAQQRHADRSFLLAAFRIGKVTYSIHNANSRRFLERLCEDEGRSSNLIGEGLLHLDHAFSHHDKPRVTQQVVLLRTTPS